jgi:hypothetical protein
MLSGIKAIKFFGLVGVYYVARLLGWSCIYMLKLTMLIIVPNLSLSTSLVLISKIVNTLHRIIELENRLLNKAIRAGDDYLLNRYRDKL